MDSFDVIISPKALSQFLRHRYVMLYRTDGANAYVDAIYHQLQDYENTFAEELSQ